MGNRDQQTENLQATVTTAGLGAGTLPPAHLHALTDAVDKTDTALRQLLSSTT
ncbi:hypothetical protein WN990_16060 [Kitasatospora purpeofusca]|uniref:hypothetical protein n=1 Tax=Kitasatospora purpeofusca TaxID=67352 RepID=UPI0030F1E73E